MKNPIKIRRNGDAPAAPPSNTAAPRPVAFPAPPPVSAAQAPQDNAETIDLERRRAQLVAKVAELQWDLGGLVFEMAIRNRIRPDVIVQRAAALQDADAELGEVERILRMERTGVAALCLTCGAPHSSGAVYCWQCGGSLMDKLPSAAIPATRA